MRIHLFLLLFPLLCFSQSYDDSQLEKLIEEKQYVNAKLILNKRLDKNPNDLEAIEFLGDVYSYEKNWDLAIEHYKMLVDHNNKIANYQYKYGGALGMKAKSVSKLRAISYLDDVEAAFLKAVELDPKHSDAHWALALYYMHVPGILGGGKNKALHYANKLEELSKVDGYLAKGHLYEDDKEYDIAENYYKKAVEIGGSLTCYTHLADLYVNKKDYDRAIATLREGYNHTKEDSLLIKIKAIEANR
jgi:tetratricopeptide (TPR) repeat protein